MKKDQYIETACYMVRFVSRSDRMKGTIMTRNVLYAVDAASRTEAIRIARKKAGKGMILSGVSIDYL